jgi:hypothetical protein
MILTISVLSLALLEADVELDEDMDLLDSSLPARIDIPSVVEDSSGCVFEIVTGSAFGLVAGNLKTMIAIIIVQTMIANTDLRIRKRIL